MPVVGAPATTTTNPPVGTNNTPVTDAAQNAANQATTNPAGFNATVASGFASPAFDSQIASYLLGAAAPGIGQQGVTAATGLEELGVAGPSLASAEQNYALGQGYDIAGALLNQQGIGLQSQQLGATAQTQAEQQAIEQGQYGLQQQGLASQMAQLAYQFPLQQQQQEGAAAASGASNSVGNRQTLAENQAFNGAGGFNEQSLFRQQQLAGLGQASEVAGYQGQQAQNQLGQQQLQLAAKQANIPVEQLEAQMGYGLQQLGVQQDITSLLGQIGTAQSGQAGALASVVGQAAATTGAGPNAFSSIY